MSTGYLGTTTTTDPGSLTIEQRLARLEKAVEQHDRRAADRRMWLWYYGYSAMMAMGIAVIVYLAASLD